MKTILILLLIVLARIVSAAEDFSDYPIAVPKAIPARAVQIEKTFGVEFVKLEHFGDKVPPYWSFRLADNDTPLGWMYFLVPVNATFAQVNDCIYSALFCYGASVSGMKQLFQKYLDKQAQANTKK